MHRKKNLWGIWTSCILIASLFMYLAWPTHKLPFLAFIGLPLLVVGIRNTPSNSIKQIILLSIALLVFRFLWVGGNSLWLADSTPKSFYYFTLIDGLIFSFVLLPSAASLCKRKKYAYLFFATSWMSFELISQHFSLSQPFFSLGFVFGEFPSLIQFYKYIGIEGGSLIILVISLSISRLLDSKFEGATIHRRVFITLGISTLPFIFSPFLSLSDKSANDIQVLAIHSYRETYNEKYHQNPELIVDQLWELSKNALKKHPNAELLVWPETLISNLDWLSNQKESRAYKRIADKLQDYPNLTLVTGGYGFSLATNGEENPYASFDEINKRYYSGHNVAMSIKANGNSYLRSKEQFIPFQEQVPYLGNLPFLRNFVDVVGSNISTSYYDRGTDFHPINRGYGYTPILCYESVFPLFMSRKLQNNGLMVLLANEYWNPNLAGSERYLAANSPIAIQSGISIVRSSNSGISAIIDSNGKIVKRKSKNQIGFLFAEIDIKQSMTVYEHIAGFIYFPSLIISIGLILYYLVRRISKRRS